MENLKRPVEIRLRFEAEGNKITLEERGDTTVMVCCYHSGKKAVLLTFASILTEQERRLLLGQY